MKERFFPRGAIASFIGMVVLYILIWVVVYLVMIARS